MDISELKKHSALIYSNKEAILDQWLSYDIVKQILEQYIDLKEFRKDYATLVLDYYFDVINDKQTIGECPVINKFIEFFSYRNVPVYEVYTICTHMRLVLLDCTFEHNIASRNMNDQINYIVDRNLSGVMKRYQDVLEDKTKEVEEYATVLQQYKDAIDESSIVSKTDKSGKIVFVNDNFCKISGYKKEELIGQFHNIVRHQDMSAERFKELWATITAKKSWSGVLVNRAKDGKTYYVNTIIFPILDLSGEIIEFMSIRHDLTELINLNNEIEETQAELIYKMGEIGETRSQETGNHVKRVAQYTRLLAEHIEMNENEIKILVHASPMHDIGKVGIPDSILKKPGKLTPDEFDVMKTHAEIGYNILYTCERPIIKAAATVSLEHHERWDGGGYPRGLKGEDIHIYGRITAVADVFDALGSDRIYKKAWPIEEVLDYFKEQRGKQFDPVLTDILLSNIEKFLAIKDEFSDDFSGQYC